MTTRHALFAMARAFKTAIPILATAASVSLAFATSTIGCDDGITNVDDPEEPPTATVMDAATEASPIGDAGLAPLTPTAVECGATPCVIALSSAPAQATFCALLSDGHVACWGVGADGALGRGTNAVDGGEDPVGPGSIPANVVGVENAVAIDGTCAVLADGRVRCWGSGRLFLQSEDAGTVFPEPVVLPIPAARAVRMGGDVACAWLRDDSLSCWGFDSHGQLTYATSAGAATPPVVPTTVPGFAAGEAHDLRDFGVGHATFVLDEGGALTTWGSMDALGRATSLSPDPYPRPALGDVTAMSVAGPNGCAVSKRELLCWGPGRMVPTPRGVPNDVVRVSIDDTPSATLTKRGCAVTASGNVHCWGANVFGQAGDGTTNLATTPVHVAGLPAAAVDVRLTPTATCALLVDGRVACWGDGSLGQTGQGFIGGITAVPVEVSWQ